MEMEADGEIIIDKICRACLSTENNTREVVETDEDYEYFLEIYKTCTSVDLKETKNLSLHICENCLTRLEEFNNFREMCIQSHTTLQNILQTVENIKIEEETVITDNDFDNNPVTTVNNTEELVEDIKEEIIEATDESTLKEKFSCEICFETFDNLTAFGEHHKTMHSTKDYKCGICALAFNHPALLTRHIKTHTREETTSVNYKVYHCNRCEKCYKNLPNLQVHVYSHLGLKPYKCDVCPKAFTKQSSLMTHKNIHKGLLNFLCSECGKQCHSALHLKRHIYVHTGIRPFECRICSRSFVTPVDLTVHVRTHTGERPFLCSTCGKAFQRVSHLNVHRRIHTGEKPYKCSFCGKCFTQAGDRNSHQRIHTGDKRHGCTVCDKRFNHSTALMMHKKTHEHSTLICNVCNKKFSRLGCYEKHVLLHNTKSEPDEDILEETV